MDASGHSSFCFDEYPHDDLKPLFRAGDYSVVAGSARHLCTVAKQPQHCLRLNEEVGGFMRSEMLSHSTMLRGPKFVHEVGARRPGCGRGCARGG